MNYCSHCGTKIVNPIFPIKCGNCLKEFYSNPLPIIVLAVKTDKNRFLLQKRNIEPKKGQYALISGYMEKNENPIDSAKREALEECNIHVENLIFHEFKVSKNGDLLICLEGKVKEENMNFKENNEVSEIKLVNTYENLAFETHSLFLKKLINP